MSDGPNRLSPEQRAQAREGILRSKLYNIMSIACALGGFILAVLLYQNAANGSPSELIQKPFILLIILLPFVPASFLAIKSRKQYAIASAILEPFYASLKPEEVHRVKEQLESF